ncbi:hypothetical protein N824_01865 [Pedobacter sp. V48]|nr:hypothetical protein N824_01865 [Pedobacter sp. V48]
MIGLSIDSKIVKHGFNDFIKLFAELAAAVPKTKTLIGNFRCNIIFPVAYA